MFKPFAKTGIRSEDEVLFLGRLEALLEPSRGLILTRISSLSNACSLLALYLDRVNWVGFYLRETDGKRGIDHLVLGPFQGAPACIDIQVGKGVCGTACATGVTQQIRNVNSFPGYIACDVNSQSEVVVPIKVSGNVVAVLDVDSPELDRFSPEDVSLLEQTAEMISRYW